MTSTRPLLFALALLPTLLIACARDRSDLNAAARFGAAASTLAQTAEAELLHIRREVIALRTERASLDPPSTATASTALAPSALAIDAGVDAAQAEVRVAATRALDSFGTLLTLAAADADTREPLAQAMDATRAQRLWRTDELTDARADALVDLADTVAARSLTARRAAAVRRALLQTESAIQELAAALRADFDPEAGRWITNITNERIESQLLCERLEAVTAADARDGQHERLRSARALAARAGQADAAALHAAERLHAALDALLLAHRDLLARVRSDQPLTLDEIDAFLDEAERLKLTWDILRAN